MTFPCPGEPRGLRPAGVQAAGADPEELGQVEPGPQEEQGGRILLGRAVREHGSYQHNMYSNGRYRLRPHIMTNLLRFFVITVFALDFLVLFVHSCRYKGHTI